MTDNDSVTKKNDREQEKAEGKGDSEGNAVNTANPIPSSCEDETHEQETFEETWSPESTDSICEHYDDDDIDHDDYEEDDEYGEDYDLRRPEDLLPTLVLLNAFFARKPFKTPSPLQTLSSRLLGSAKRGVR